MHTPSPRQNKVSRLIQKDLSEMFQQYARDWAPGVLISVPAVRVSPDFGFAKVYISVFPTTKGPEVLEHLNLAIKEIRFKLGQRIRNQLRTIPEIALFLDDSLDYLENIDSLLKQ